MSLTYMDGVPGGATSDNQVKMNLDKIEEHREKLKILYYEIQTVLDDFKSATLQAEEYMKGKGGDHLAELVSAIASDIIEPSHEYNMKMIAALNVAKRTYSSEEIQVL